MIEIVLKMLFGDVDERSIRSIVKATSTYSNSAERTAALVKRMSSSHFLVRDNASTILNSYLIMNATNKGNKSLAEKLFNYVCADGIMRLGSSNVDNTGIKHDIVLLRFWLGLLLLLHTEQSLLISYLLYRVHVT